MPGNKALIIATEGLTTNLLFESLSKEFEIQGVIIESSVSKLSVLKNRIQKIGLFPVIGHVLFLILVLPFIKSKKRTEEILDKHGYKGNEIPKNLKERIESVNSPRLLELIETYQPDIIFINGTRIIKAEVLAEIKKPVINIHVGITPAYRGVHGGYWALYEGRPELFGVTVHFVDSGIDTGKIIEQSVISTSKKDNFKTYPVLQYSEGLRLLENRSSEIITGNIKTVEPFTENTKLHYHPGIFQYLMRRIFKGVK